MKRLLLILAICTMIFYISGCSSNSSEEKLTFSDYYQSMGQFDEISPYLEEYFSCIQSAYDNSDKQNIETFILPDEYENAKDALQSYNDANALTIRLNMDDEAEDVYLETTALLLPYLHLETKMAEHRLLLAAYGHLQDEDWFEELNSLVEDSIEEYRTGVDE